jgi:hypothetical protein
MLITRIAVYFNYIKASSLNLTRLYFNSALFLLSYKRTVSKILQGGSNGTIETQGVLGCKNDCTKRKINLRSKSW